MEKYILTQRLLHILQALMVISLTPHAFWFACYIGLRIGIIRQGYWMPRLKLLQEILFLQGILGPPSSALLRDSATDKNYLRRCNDQGQSSCVYFLYAMLSQPFHA